MNLNNKSDQKYLYPFLERFGDLITDEAALDADFTNFEQFYCHVYTTESNRQELESTEEGSMFSKLMEINDVRVMNFKN